MNLAREDAEVKALIQNSGLAQLQNASYKIVNRVIISAFVERWHPETNTFHMPWGEMTITLDDVQQMLNLNVVGKAMHDCEKLSFIQISQLLEISQVDVVSEIQHNRNQSLRTSWLIERLSMDGESKVQNATHAQIARGYLLVLLGCTLFQDRSGDKVHIKYLAYLQHIEKVHEWAWGAGLLAYTYRMLGKASIYETKALAGYLTLVEAWVYEHFPKLRTGKPYPLVENMQMTQQWRSQTQASMKDAGKQLHYMRCDLDRLDHKSIKNLVWTPYRDMGDDPELITWFSGCLVMEKIVEAYHPNRVVRQFGRVQDKPRPPIRPRIASRQKVKAYQVKYDNRTEDYDSYTHHLIPEEERGPRATKNGQCTRAYNEWYNSIAIRHLSRGLKYSSLESMPEEEEIQSGMKSKLLGMLENLGKEALKMTKKEVQKRIFAAVVFLKHGQCSTSDATTSKGSNEGDRKRKGKEKVIKETRSKSKLPLKRKR